MCHWAVVRILAPVACLLRRPSVSGQRGCAARRWACLWACRGSPSLSRGASGDAKGQSLAVGLGRARQGVSAWGGGRTRPASPLAPRPPRLGDGQSAFGATACQAVFVSRDTPEAEGPQPRQHRLVPAVMLGDVVDVRTGGGEEVLLVTSLQAKDDTDSPSSLRRRKKRPRTLSAGVPYQRPSATSGSSRPSSHSFSHLIHHLVQTPSGRRLGLLARGGARGKALR